MIPRTVAWEILNWAAYVAQDTGWRLGFSMHQILNLLGGDVKSDENY